MEKKIVLITGASSGIGEGCARKFAMNGYRLILNGRNMEKLTAVKRELETEYRADVCLLPFDVRDRGTAKAALDSLPEEWKAIDILVNNAGLVIGVDKEHEGNLDEWDIVLDTNVKSLLAMTRLVVPGMVERGRGHVINMGSIAGDYAYPGGSVYCASKAAVKALSDGLRIDLVDTPVRVTNIKPGVQGYPSAYGRRYCRGGVLCRRRTRTHTGGRGAGNARQSGDGYNRQPEIEALP